MPGDGLSFMVTSVDKTGMVCTHVFILRVLGRKFFEIYFSDTTNSTKIKLNGVRKLGIRMFGLGAVISDRVVTEFSLSRNLKAE